MLLLPYRTDQELTSRPFITYGLIGINFLIFLGTVFLDPATREIMAMDFGFIPEEWYRFHTAFISMFLHAGWLHVFSNMFFLWVFGPVVENRLGRLRFVLLYIGTGLLGNIVHGFTVAPFFADLPCIGASGAISGVLGAFMVTAPTAKLDCVYIWILFLRPLIGVARLPGLLFLAGWFLVQLIYATSLTSAAGAVGVAFWAHVGGFAAGALLVGGRQLLGVWQNYGRARQEAARINAAQQAYVAGDLTTAVQGLEALEPEQPELAPLLARARFEMAQTKTAVELALKILDRSVSRKDQKAIIDMYYLLQEAKQEDQLRAHHYLILGQSFSHFKKPRHALTAYINGLDRFPENDETDIMLFNLGELYAETGDQSRADQAFEVLTEEYPDSKFTQSVNWSK